MATNDLPFNNSAEHLVAELTDAAYRVALRHGVRGPFDQLELELWRELRAVFRRGTAIPRQHHVVESSAVRVVEGVA
jgi:hypothetical protein